MDSEAQLTSGAAANMVAGENPSPLVTANGVTNVLCIDPKDSAGSLGGFALPDMSEDGDESDCTGATVSHYFCFGNLNKARSYYIIRSAPFTA